MDALTLIRNEGFTVKLDGNDFTVAPSHLLTSKQRNFLKKHKTRIIDALLITVVYTPAGARIEIKARDAQHQAWLIAHNHNSSTPVVFPDTEDVFGNDN
jgi:hypothetical protein